MNRNILIGGAWPYANGSLNISDDWGYKTVQEGLVLPEINILFERLDKKVIEEERNRLNICN